MQNPQHRPHGPTNPYGYGQGHYYRTRKISPIAIVGIVAGVVAVVAAIGIFALTVFVSVAC